MVAEAEKEKEETAAKAAARRGRQKQAAKDLEVLTSLAEGLKMCSDVSETEQLHREMQLAMKNILPGAHLAAAASKGEALRVPLAPSIVSFAKLPPDYIRLHEPATQSDALAAMQAEINRLVQCGLLLTRFKPGGFDFYHLLLSRLEQVFVVQGECSWGKAVGNFLDADGFELVRALARGAPQEYAGPLAHILCLLLLRLVPPLARTLSDEQRALAPASQLFADLRTVVERAKLCDTFTAGVLCACILADRKLCKPLVQAGLLPCLVEYARRLQARARAAAAEEELACPSSLTNVVLAFSRLCNESAAAADEDAKQVAPAQPFWHVPPAKPQSYAAKIRSSGIANVMLEYLAKGRYAPVKEALRGQLDWINLYATGGPEPLSCTFPDTPHYQTFNFAGCCERGQTFRFEVRLKGHVPGADLHACETPQEKKRRLEKGKARRTMTISRG